MLARIHLHHLRDVEGIYARKRISSNEDDATVCVDLPLSISEFDCLQDWTILAHGSDNWRTASIQACIPAGSFRWERLVRSSLASSMEGFINGGKDGLFGSWSSACVVSTIFVYGCGNGRSVLGSPRSTWHWTTHTSPFSHKNSRITLSPSTRFSLTSEGIQPSVGSGCHALVPTS